VANSWKSITVVLSLKIINLPIGAGKGQPFLAICYVNADLQPATRCLPQFEFYGRSP
jgi:hypothetical protein